MRNRSAPLLLLASTLTPAAFVASVPSLAQGIVQPLPGTTDADALADQMRRVTADPRDVNALAAAGELSLKLDDLSGAASLFARAERIDPRNGRVKAGEASLLLRSERPGEALRYFAQAESYGLVPTRFAADRGLAYDLIGQQERAQRDYRAALKTRVDDETIRRYALSLGISGRKDEALDQLAPLLRRQDRGAWRARAFVLAMTGDVASASKIATTMMPPGMAQGLQPFFERLPSLPAADRAFAVHFGEVRPTPERLADARLAPALATLPPEVGVPVRVASVRPIAPVGASGGDRRRDRRARRDETRLAVVQPAPVLVPAPVRLAAAQPVTQPRPQARIASVAAAQTATRPRYYSQPVPGSLLPRLVRVEPAHPAPAPVRRVETPTTPVIAPSVELAAAGPAPNAAIGTLVPRPAAVAPAPLAVRTSIGEPAPATALAAAPPVVSPPVTSPPVLASTSNLAPSSAVIRVATASDSSTTSLAPPVTSASRASLPSTPRPGFSSLPDTLAAAAPTPSPVRRDGDAILARIVANLSVPASELDVAEPTRSAAARRVASSTRVAASTGVVSRSRRRVRSADDVELASLDGKPTGRRSPAGRKAAPAEAVEEPETAPLTRAEKRAAARKAMNRKAPVEEIPDDTPRAPAERRAAARKAVTDKKALADKRLAADKKALADKEALEEKKVAKTNPPRIWVQVSGGANESDLPKAYASVRSKAPDAFAGRAAFATPLRATNRVLTGPFKTDAEARAFVNQLAKKGVSAFTFTSDKGQKVERLGSKSAK